MLDAVDAVPASPETAAPAPAARVEAAPPAPVVHNGQLFGGAASENTATTDAAAHAAHAEAREDIPTDAPQAEDADPRDQEKKDNA